jgi:hypothetical protein
MHDLLHELQEKRCKKGECINKIPHSRLRQAMLRRQSGGYLELAATLASGIQELISSHPVIMEEDK